MQSFSNWRKSNKVILYFIKNLSKIFIFKTETQYEKYVFSRSY